MYEEALTANIQGFSKTPMAKVIWMVLLAAWQHPFLLLLVQALAFWSGLTLIVASCRVGPIGSMALILVLGFFPAVFGLLGMLWADVMLAASLLLFVGLALYGEQRRSKALLAVSVIPLWCGLAMRVNAAPAVLPLVPWFLFLWGRVSGWPSPSWRQATWRAAALFAVLLALVHAFDRAVITRGSGSYGRSLQFAMFHDLAGIATTTGDLRLPPHVYRNLPQVNLDVIRQAYDAADVNLLIYNRAWASTAFLTADRGEFLELVHVWAGAVRDHPAAYVRRRLQAVAAGFQVRGVHYPFHTGIDPNDLGLHFGGPPEYWRLVAWLDATKGVFFRGWVFLCAAVATIWIGARRRCWSAVAVAASGVCYVIPYAVITTGADFRYVWWLVVSSLAGTALLVTDRTGRHRAISEAGS
jgi:hypothetical protein